MPETRAELALLSRWFELRISGNLSIWHYLQKLGQRARHLFSVVRVKNRDQIRGHSFSLRFFPFSPHDRFGAVGADCKFIFFGFDFGGKRDAL